MAATIRTDRYEVMQNHPALDGVDSVLFDELKPMPPSQFKEVITGPAAAQRAGRPARALRARPGRAAARGCRRGRRHLPLLSLTLARLYADWIDVGAG